MRQLQHKHNLFEIALAGITAVEGASCVRDFLSKKYTCTDAPLYLVAIGKAAESMTMGAMELLDKRIRAGLVISKTGHFTTHHLARYSQLELIEAGHPIPDQNSLRSGKKLINFLTKVPSNAKFLFLISGGASSLVEVPNINISLAFLQQTNQWLLSSGLDIHQINSVRKGLSQIKGGQLINFVAGRAVKLLMISDVPGDQEENIASGLLVPPQTGRLPELPDWLHDKIRTLPKLQPKQFRCIDSAIIAKNFDARSYAANKARSMGYRVRVHPLEVIGNTHQVAQQLVNEMHEQPDILHIWGGETTLQLPKNPGRGGRNQSLALMAATCINNENHKSYFLSIGTDGSDGPGNDAGAIVDSSTIVRGRQHGLSASDSLKKADAGHYLSVTGDLISTGPTGTNVMDIMVGFHCTL